MALGLFDRFKRRPDIPISTETQNETAGKMTAGAALDSNAE